MHMERIAGLIRPQENGWLRLTDYHTSREVASLEFLTKVGRITRNPANLSEFKFKD